MKIFSDYVWSSECGDSVLLKQVRQGKKTVVFGCVGANYLAGSYVLERLGVWFQKRGLALCLSGVGQQKIEQEIREVLVQTRKELAHYGGKVQEIQQKEDVSLELSMQGQGMMKMSVTGFLTVGNYFWLIHEGNNCCYLVNRYFNRSHVEMLAGEECLERKSMDNAEGKECCEGDVVSGILQRGVGILLCTQAYRETITEEMIKQCLSVTEVRREGQVGRRLKELQRVGSAVYILLK